ncbi:MAG: polysaccharide deacetylase family protein [Candidatus Krumholzibacteriota bacterium]|nr:polysaccharide deacetylase family protein [Candidatus Krumholzibacteriota bacterium]
MINYVSKKSIVIIVFLITSCILSSCANDRDSGFDNRAPRSEAGIPVLAYHYLNDRNRFEQGGRALGTVLLNLPLLTVKDAWTVRLDDFEKQLRCLDKNGYKTITMDELKSFMTGREEMTGNCVAITFDDGDRSVYKYAYPLLKKYDMKGTLFIVTSKVGRNWNSLNISPWKELREMEESGVIDIESHTHDMHSKLREGDIPHPVFIVSGETIDNSRKEKIFNDLRRSKVSLNFNLGTGSNFLAWPYGFGTDISDSLAAAAGFEGILTLKSGRNYPGDPLSGIKRFAVTSKTSFTRFKKIVGIDCN